MVRFGYGALVPWVYRQDDGTLRAIAGPDQAVLRTTVPLRGDGPKTIGDFMVAEGEAISFTLSYAPSHLPPPDPADPFAALEVTERFWNGWSAQARIEEGERHGAVMRSLITLKALTIRVRQAELSPLRPPACRRLWAAFAIGITAFVPRSARPPNFFWTPARRIRIGQRCDEHRPVVVL